MPRNRIGSIRWKHGAWEVCVQRGFALDGMPNKAYATVHGTREEAEMKAALMAQELGRPDALDPSMTLRRYWEDVFPAKPSMRGTPRCKATMRRYANDLRHALEVLGDRPVSGIRHAEMAAAIHSSPSPKNAKTALRAVMRSAYDDGLIGEMPFQRRVPTHRERRPQAQPWTRFEVAGFFAALDAAPLDPSEDRDALEAYAILGLCGLSKSEALGIRPMDIREQTAYSFATGEEVATVTVTVAMTYTDEDGLKAWAKNDHRQRTVPVPQALRGRLKRLVSLSRARWEGDAREWAETRLVRKGGANLVRDWRRLCGRLGVRYIPPGMLRHTTDTLALTAGVAADLNDKMHGRSEHGSTYRNYFRPDLGAMDDAARRVSDMLILDTSCETDVRKRK